MTQAGANVVEIQVRSKDMSGPGFDAARKRAKGLAQDIDGGQGSAGAALVSAEKKAKGLTDTLSRVGTVAGGILAADILREAAQRVTQMAQQTVHAASSLGESLNAVDKTFGASSKVIHDWAENNAASFGLSQRAFNEAATPLGAMLKNQGLTMKEVEAQTIKLTKRSADMASVFNVNVGDALTAIQAGLRGESDPLERFGVSLQAAAVDARALADSGKTTTAQLTQQERAMARLNLIYDQTAQTQGDFADTSTGLANAQRIATARIEDAQAKIGSTFLPVMAAAANASGKFAETIAMIPGPVAAAAAVIGVAGAALLLFAPRIMDTKEALDRMATSQSAVTRGAGRLAVGVGKVGGALAAVTIAAQVIGSFMSTSLGPTLEGLDADMANWARTGKIAGEAARLFGDDAVVLDRSLKLASSSSLGFGQFVEGWLPPLQAAELSATKVTERVKALDTGLAAMVRNGQGDQAFKVLAERARATGLSLDDLKKILPEYANAINAAARETGGMSFEAQAAAASLDELEKQFDETFKKVFGFEESQDAAADAVARLNAQIAQQVEDGVAGAGTLDRNTQAGRDNAESIRDLVKKYEEMMVQAQKTGASTDGMAKQLEDQIVSMGFSRAEAERYVKALGDVKAALDLIQSKEILLTVRAGSQTLAYLSGSDSALLKGYEHGGIIGAAGGGPRAGRTLVGEHGPEIADLAPGTNVHSAEDSQRMMSAEASTGWSGYGPAGGGGGGGSLGFVEVGSDGTGMGDWIIELLAGIIRGRGGDPSLIGLKIRT